MPFLSLVSHNIGGGIYTLYDTGFLSIDIFQFLGMALQREKKVVSIIGLPVLISSSCLFSKTPSGEKILQTKNMLLLYKDSLKGMRMATLET